MALLINSKPPSRDLRNSSSETQTQLFKSAQKTSYQQKLEEFDRFKHSAPRYNIYGIEKKTENKPNQDGRNVLKEQIKIPEWWSKPGTKDEDKKTQQKIIQQRKAESIPHISYDLDGDGYVGGRDIVIAKYFDKDQDGILNQQERENAMQALKEGFEDQFIWGVEQSGVNTMHRLLQKRGVFVHGENFLDVGKTYPEHPLSKQPRKYKNQSELYQQRKDNLKQQIEKQKQAWDEANPRYVEQKQILSEFYCENPKRTSQQEILNENKLLARTKCGLTQNFVDIKDSSKDPTLKYVEQPEIKSKSDLELKRKKQNFEDFKKTEAIQGNHKDGMQRLKEREDCYLRISYKDVDGKTKRTLDENRRKEMLDYNMKTFGKVSIGVHGKELPKFHEDEEVKEYWKIRGGFNQNPNYQSAKQLSQDHKYWAKNDELYLADVKEGMGPIDHFKQTHIKYEKKENVIEKVNHITYQPPTDQAEMEGPGVKTQHNYKWTTVENQFTRKKKRLFDELPPAQLTRADQQPLFSSFNPKGQFNAPIDQLIKASNQQKIDNNLSASKRTSAPGQLNKSQGNAINKDNGLEDNGQNNAYQGNQVKGEALYLLKPSGFTMFNRVQTSYGMSRSQNMFNTGGSNTNVNAMNQRPSGTSANDASKEYSNKLGYRGHNNHLKMNQSGGGSGGIMGSNASNFRSAAQVGVRSGAFNIVKDTQQNQQQNLPPPTSRTSKN